MAWPALALTHDFLIHDILSENNEVLGWIVLQVIKTKPHYGLIAKHYHPLRP